MARSCGNSLSNSMNPSARCSDARSPNRTGLPSKTQNTMTQQLILAAAGIGLAPKVLIAALGVLVILGSMMAVDGLTLDQVKGVIEPGLREIKTGIETISGRVKIIEDKAKSDEEARKKADDDAKQKAKER